MQVYKVLNQDQYKKMIELRQELRKGELVNEKKLSKLQKGSIHNASPKRVSK